MIRIKIKLRRELNNLTGRVFKASPDGEFIYLIKESDQYNHYDVWRCMDDIPRYRVESFLKSHIIRNILSGNWILKEKCNI